MLHLRRRREWITLLDHQGRGDIFRADSPGHHREQMPACDLAREQADEACDAADLALDSLDEDEEDGEVIE